MAGEERSPLWILPVLLRAVALGIRARKIILLFYHPLFSGLSNRIRSNHAHDPSYRSARFNISRPDHELSLTHRRGDHLPNIRVCQRLIVDPAASQFLSHTLDAITFSVVNVRINV